MPPKVKRQAEAKLDAALRELAEFEAGFKKSSNGNPTREWEGYQLTIFEKHGKFSWSICNRDDGETSYSEDKYESRDDAMSALAMHLDIGRL